MIGVVTAAVVFFGYAGYATVTYNVTDRSVMNIEREAAALADHYAARQARTRSNNSQGRGREE
ncbi:hypothetical protein CAI21_08415 [Alkalilimnicola ehrlichii]|uniref:Uncharacterized protein n=1 Tax=Alkalilimnicola ehrlichii TaxID=351052 RepID=A0A3E0WWQ4_9GAMM|nr:hypothetical protein CAI21_08415 [Alkalilimnicola ehrlichii]RFA36436.1 hypothetical protein CAL65_10680 [Alkalilimnicola ehrlichii]